MGGGDICGAEGGDAVGRDERDAKSSKCRERESKGGETLEKFTGSKEERRLGEGNDAGEMWKTSFQGIAG